MKARSLCDQHGIPKVKNERTRMSQIGGAGVMSKENKDEVLRDVQRLTQFELRNMYRAKKDEAKPKAKISQQSIQWTEEIQHALRHASRFTRSNELQANLEIIAKSFTSMMPTSPANEIRFRMN